MVESWRVSAEMGSFFHPVAGKTSPARYSPALTPLLADLLTLLDQNQAQVLRLQQALGVDLGHSGTAERRQARRDLGGWRLSSGG